MDFIRAVFMVAFIGGVFFLGAYTHEGDIQRACGKYGESREATWRGPLICFPDEK